MIAASVLWGTTGTVAHQAPPGSDQMLIGLSTFGFGGLALYAANVRSATRLVLSPSATPLLASGATGVVVYSALYYASMALVGVAVGNALALGSGPVFAALLELVVDRKRVSRCWAVATGVALAGIACLAASAHSAPGRSPLLGVVLGLGAGLGYALYSWAGARLISVGHPSRCAMAAVFACAACVLVPWFLLSHLGPLVSGRGLAVLTYLALGPMAVAYVMFGFGLRRLTASTATTIALIEPIVATVLAATVLHERLAVLGWCGLALIGLGIVVVAATERGGVE